MIYNSGDCKNSKSVICIHSSTIIPVDGAKPGRQPGGSRLFSAELIHIAFPACSLHSSPHLNPKLTLVNLFYLDKLKDSDQELFRQTNESLIFPLFGIQAL